MSNYKLTAFNTFTKNYFIKITAFSASLIELWTFYFDQIEKKIFLKKESSTYQKQKTELSKTKSEQ